MPDTIENMTDFQEVKPYSGLADCFPRGILPTDIDGEVEINFHFLWFEWKRKGQTMKTGQKLAFLRRLRMIGRCATMFVVTHDKKRRDVIKMSDVVGFHVLRCPRDTVFRWGTFDDLPWWCSQWSQHAQQKPNRFLETLSRHQATEELKVEVKDLVKRFSHHR